MVVNRSFKNRFLDGEIFYLHLIRDDGSEPDSLEYRPIKITVGDFSSLEPRTGFRFRNHKSLYFPVSRESWGTVVGCELKDSIGEIIGEDSWFLHKDITSFTECVFFVGDIELHSI